MISGESTKAVTQLNQCYLSGVNHGHRGFQGQNGTRASICLGNPGGNRDTDPIKGPKEARACAKGTGGGTRTGLQGECPGSAPPCQANPV